MTAAVAGTVAEEAAFALHSDVECPERLWYSQNLFGSPLGRRPDVARFLPADWLGVAEDAAATAGLGGGGRREAFNSFTNSMMALLVSLEDLAAGAGVGCKAKSTELIAAPMPSFLTRGEV